MQKNLEKSLTKFESNLVRPDGTKPKVNTLQQYLILKYFKEKESSKINWAREVKIANQLIRTYSEVSFWLNYDLDFEINSLAYFRTEAGRDKLFIDYNKFLLDFAPKKEYYLSDKVGEDKQFQKKKTLKDFLNEPTTASNQT